VAAGKGREDCHEWRPVEFVRPNVRAKLPAEEADDRPRRDDGNARPERPGIGCRSGSA
jgi:hypothetical protein